MTTFRALYRFMLLLMAASLSFAVPVLAEARPQSIKVVMDNNYPPYVFLDGAGKLQGILIDQWRLWEQKSGIRVDIRAMDWGKALSGMKAGEFDVIDTIFKTDERSGWLDFSQPYAKLEVPIFFEKNISGITGAASLKGFVVAAKSGDDAVDLLKRNGVENLVLYNSYEAVILAAKEHKVTVFVVDNPPAQYFLHKFGIIENYRRSNPLNVGEFHRAVKKGNGELLKIVEDGFALISQDELKKIETNWYGTSLEHSSYLRYFMFACTGLGLLVLILFVSNRILRRAVDNRTADLKDSEEMLRENQYLLTEIIELSPISMAIVSMDGTIERINRQAIETFGYLPDDIPDMDRWWVQAYPDETYRAEVIAQFMGLVGLAIAEKHEIERREYRVTCKDGTIKTTLIFGIPVLDKLFVMFDDITESKKAEDALEESRERYRGLSEAGFEAIFFSENGICIEQNKNAALMFGYSDSEAIGRKATEWIVPEDREQVVLKMVSGSEDRYEVTALRKDGTTFPALIRARMMHYKGKDIRVTSLSDISVRKKAEGDRLNLERQLLHAQKLESLGVLSGGIAHDFNNLLQALLGNLDLALLKLPDDAAGIRNIHQAINAGKHAAKLTNMMLAYSGKGLFIIKELNLTELVEENAAMLEASISKSVSLDLDLDQTLPPIMADPGQLQQVIMNLITNASEAIGEQGGKIKLSTGVKEFDQAALNNSRLEEKLPAGRYIWLKVSDSGCGMDEDTLLKLFDPFFTTKFTGRGLGMSAVLGIIRAHRGGFLVESRLAVGTTIQALFPIADLPQTELPDAAAVSSDSATAVDHGRRLILVVDDEDMIRVVCVAMLEELGFEALSAATGEEALRIFSEQGDKIDLVLLDQVMPEMDGVTVFNQMRRIRPEIRVLLASGFSEQEVADRFKGLGLNGFIPKPFDLQQLSGVLRRVLEGDSDVASN